jgi:hypothetical protein
MNKLIREILKKRNGKEVIVTESKGNKLKSYKTTIDLYITDFSPSTININVNSISSFYIL